MSDRFTGASDGGPRPDDDKKPLDRDRHDRHQGFRADEIGRRITRVNEALDMVGKKAATLKHVGAELTQAARIRELEAALRKSVNEANRPLATHEERTAFMEGVLMQILGATSDDIYTEAHIHLIAEHAAERIVEALMPGGDTTHLQEDLEHLLVEFDDFKAVREKAQRDTPPPEIKE